MSTNAGATWTQMVSIANSNFNYVNKIAVDPVGASIQRQPAAQRANRTDEHDQGFAFVGVGGAARRLPGYVNARQTEV